MPRRLLTALTLQEQATPATPAAGGMTLFATLAGELAAVDDAGNVWLSSAPKARVFDEGVFILDATGLNFVGAGVTATDDLDGGVTVTIPGGAGSDPAEGSYAPGSFTLETGKYSIMAKRLTLTGSQRATLEGTARLLAL